MISRTVWTEVRDFTHPTRLAVDIDPPSFY